MQATQARPSLGALDWPQPRAGRAGKSYLDDSGLGRRGCISGRAVSAILTGRAAFHPLAFAAERCWSGRTGLPAKQLHLKRAWGVRIPPSPPYSKPPRKTLGVTTLGR